MERLAFQRLLRESVGEKRAHYSSEKLCQGLASSPLEDVAGCNYNNVVASGKWSWFEVAVGSLSRNLGAGAWSAA